MMNNNKILTVSYGTFSCTLEGFDDSFGTMKAIAEYFRDLASDDRYFGAEPPQPDAEMLARIAEREISRRVEAREHDGRIVLSATDGSSAEQTSQLAAAAVAAPIAAAATVLAQTDSVAPEVADVPAEDQRPEADESIDADETETAVGASSEELTSDTVEEEAEPDALEEPQAADAPAPKAEAEMVAEAETNVDAEVEEEILDEMQDVDVTVTEIGAETDIPTEKDIITEMTAEVKEEAQVAAEVEVEAEVVADEELQADLEAEAQIEEEADTEVHAVSEAEAEAKAFFADAASSDMNFFEEEIEVTEEPPEDKPTSVRESIADKLQRIRAVVSRSQDDDDEAEMFEDEHAAAEDASPDLSQFIDLSEHSDVTADETADSDELSDVAPDMETEEIVAAAADDEVTQDEGRTEDDQSEYPEPVSEFGWTSDADETDADDAHAEEVIEAATHDIEAAMAADDAIAAATEADDEDDIAAILAQYDTDLAEVESAENPLTDTDDEQETVSDANGIGLDSLTALFDNENDGDEAESKTQNNVDDDFQHDAGPSDHDAPMVLSNEDMVKPGHDQHDKTEDVRARAFKVKRADIDAAIASGELETVDSDIDDQSTETSLSDEQEAELLADLAAVEASADKADITAEVDPMEAEPATQDFDHDYDFAKFDEDVVIDSMSDEIDGTEAAASKSVNDDDVSRLMAEADNQMHEPEGSLRRNAFAHLKAAVIAKKADSDIGKDDPETEGAFRSDLESVVVPRRPEARGEGSKRPEVQRPAPLKLVAEQRVDIDSAPKGPVRPRRIAAAVEDALLDENDSDFIDYVEQAGAHGLPDLLEAAASYLSFVEERDQFTRPQLMKKIRQVEGDNFSREDGLRSFGQLLRAGKIKKIKGGRFVVTAEIGYRPDHRAAG